MIDLRRYAAQLLVDGVTTADEILAVVSVER
jgi:hypothetical protein